jgi:hypothetical protein
MFTTIGGKEMYKLFITLLSFCWLIGCSDPCKGQVPIPPILESDILSYLSTNIIQPSFGGKVFSSYDPLYVEKKGNQFKYYMDILCKEVSPGLTLWTAESTFAILTIEQKGDQYRIVSHFTPDVATYMEDMRKYFPREKNVCYSRNKPAGYKNKSGSQMEKEIIDQAKLYYQQQ